MKGGFRVAECPAWLPKGWITLAKTRKTGHTAGLTDKYFIEPVSNRRFRSKKEVLRFLAFSNLSVSQPKSKRDDPGCKASSEGGNSSKVGADSASQITSAINVNTRPTKLRWVYNSSEGSWVAEDIAEANSRDDKIEIYGGQEQLQSGVSEDDSTSTRLTFETVIDLNKPKEGLPIVCPFGDSWPDPCLEFAVKTLTGAIPVLDDNLDLQNAFLRYFSPQTNADEKLWSNSGSFNSLGSVKAKSSGYNEHTDNSFSTKERPSSSWKDLDGSKGSQNYVSSSDGLPKNVNKLIRHQAKDWLEVLGRKLCKKALGFLTKNGHSAEFFDKREKTLKTSFPLSRKAQNIQEKTLRTSFRLSRKAQNIQIDRGNPQQDSVIEID